MIEDFNDFVEIADGLLAIPDFGDIAEISDITDLSGLIDTADFSDLESANDLLTTSDIELGESEFVSDTPSEYEISFGRSQNQIENDVNYYTKKLDNAQNDVNYYSKELSRSNISDTYRKNCESKLSQATKRINELTRKMSSLESELKKLN